MQLMKNNGNQPNALKDIYTSKMRLSDLTRGKTRAAIGWRSQWVEYTQVTRGCDLRCYWQMRAVGGASSARLGSCDFPPQSHLSSAW